MSESNDSGLDYFHTEKGIPMKTGQKQIVTGMDKLVNPKYSEQTDQIFDSGASRDINTGEVMSQGGIQYRGLKGGSSPLK